ncbi:hypothetical protein GF378_03370 [Candidatus Pacearchaeota archaeon]|nr:hypothetical protein [Candidatus Pacearchaeota archaeon]
MDPYEETKKRRDLAERISQDFYDYLGVVLTGSVAYSPNFKVSKNSDLDLVVVTDDLKKTLPMLIKDKKERKSLESRFFEGYCTKREIEGIPVSTHVLSKDALDIISKCFVADIRVYRPTAKNDFYTLQGFEANKYNFSIKNIPLDELKGVRTIIPVSFIHNDRYYLGVHRDKLLSNPIILNESKNYISESLDRLWKVVTENLCDESKRIHNRINLDKMNILNALSKKEKMPLEIKSAIMSKTRFYVSKYISKSI